MLQVGEARVEHAVERHEPRRGVARRGGRARRRATRRRCRASTTSAGPMFGTPPGYMRSRYRSWVPAPSTAASTHGSSRCSELYAMIALAEKPHRPRWPSLHGWRQAQSSTSATSRCDRSPERVERAVAGARAADVDVEVVVGGARRGDRRRVAVGAELDDRRPGGQRPVDERPLAGEADGELHAVGHRHPHRDRLGRARGGSRAGQRRGRPRGGRPPGRGATPRRMRRRPYLRTELFANRRIGLRWRDGSVLRTAPGPAGPDHRRGPRHRRRPRPPPPRAWRAVGRRRPRARPPRRGGRRRSAGRGGPATSPTGPASTRWSPRPSTRSAGLDVVVANAGVAAQLPLVGGDPELFDRTIAVNVLGTYYTLRAAGPAPQPPARLRRRHLVARRRRPRPAHGRLRARRRRRSRRSATRSARSCARTAGGSAWPTSPSSTPT